VTTSRSLLSLLELDDFVEASFLLSVLGEGTFLDLLAFVEELAPDPATAELARRAAKLGDVTQMPAPLHDALVTLAGRPVNALLETMHAHRVQRLQVAGFTAEQAERLSKLHTPNFM
jgi:hypothetical protein